MRAVDTNVLVRLTTGDDPRQTAIAEAFAVKGAWASTLALAETIWVLGSVYSFSRTALATSIEMLLNNRDLVIQDREAVAAALGLFKSKPSLGFSDCLILELARHSGNLPLGTFDRGLAKVQGTHKL
jgi:predicted nucleic-acid-binding protein